jgi:DNA invertase Pin-like site-specific DNA recombinase
VSGAKGRDKRPQFDALCRDATKRQFDVVMAWSVDRLGRSLQDLVAFLSDIHALKIDLYLHQQGIDTTTPAGKAMFQMMGVFAEFERAMIQERIRAGLARAKDEGTTLGRPKIDAATESAIRKALRKGDRGMRKIAADLNVGVGTVQRVKAELDESSYRSAWCQRMGGAESKGARAFCASAHPDMVSVTRTSPVLQGSFSKAWASRQEAI